MSEPTGTADRQAGRSLRILIADDHPVFVAGLRSVLDAIPGAIVVGEAGSGTEAIVADHRLQPDVVMMDVNMPGANGIEATRTIVGRRPRTAVLVLTMDDAEDTILAALRAGARGYLLKGCGLADITLALDAVAGGGAIFGSQVAGRVLERLTCPSVAQVPFPELTDRERAVLALVADGRSNQAIAAALGLSPKTVRNYLSRIFSRLQVADRAAAVVRARRAGLGN